jgi:Integrase core domain
LRPYDPCFEVDRLPVRPPITRQTHHQPTPGGNQQPLARCINQATGDDHAHKKSHIGFDYVHSVIDDHSRLAYSEILSDEKGITCAAFLQRAADYFATYGITQIERIMTDNARAYRYSLREVVAALGARQAFIKPHCGRTAKRSATTAPCKSNGPTARSSTPTTPSAQPLLPGSSTTTINGATQPRRQTPISRLSPT